VSVAATQKTSAPAIVKTNATREPGATSDIAGAACAAAPVKGGEDARHSNLLPPNLSSFLLLKAVKRCPDSGDNTLDWKVYSAGYVTALAYHTQLSGRVNLWKGF